MLTTRAGFRRTFSAATSFCRSTRHPTRSVSALTVTISWSSSNQTLDADQDQAGLPRLNGREWPSVLDDKQIRKALEDKILPGYLPKQRWYGGKARKIRNIRLREWVPLSRESMPSVLLLIEVAYHDGAEELYILPLAYHPISTDPTSESMDLPRRQHCLDDLGLIQRERSARPSSVTAFGRDLLAVIAGRKRMAGHQGRLHAAASREVTRQWQDGKADLSPRLLGAEQSNTSIRFGDQFIFKLYRRTDSGPSPGCRDGALSN